METTNEVKAAEEREAEVKPLGLPKSTYHFGPKNEACVSLGIRCSSGVTPLRFSKRGPKGGCADFYITLSADDLRQLGQAFLNFADLVDYWARNS
jgi:hypothetical protein